MFDTVSDTPRQGPSAVRPSLETGWDRSTGVGALERTKLPCVTWRAMRHTAFRQMMRDEFGQIRADTLARDLVLAELGGRTADQALQAGSEPKHVWAVMCDAFEIPPERR